MHINDLSRSCEVAHNVVLLSLLSSIYNIYHYSLAVEGSPLGSLYHHLREEGRGLADIGSNTVHHILLQVSILYK